jgi:hypothetical protein
MRLPIRKTGSFLFKKAAFPPIPFRRKVKNAIQEMGPSLLRPLS